MDTQESGPSANFTLEVENFGPIARASVDLRPLTVFVGPSNTGKSYLAVLAYALHKCFGPTRFPSYGRHRDSSVTASAKAMQADDSASPSLPEWLLHVSENSAPPLVPPHVAEHIRPALEQAEDLDLFVESEITRCFGVEHYRELIRRAGSHDGARITVKIPRYVEEASVSPGDTGADAVRYQFDLIRHRGATASGSISVGVPLHLRTEYLDDLRESVRFGRLNISRIAARNRVSDREMELLLSEVAESLLLSLFHPLNSNAFYLPASRTGVMHSHQTVVSALIRGATAGGRRPMPEIPVLSGVLADFLDDLLTLGSGPSRGRRAFAARPRRGNTRSREHFGELARLLGREHAERQHRS